MHFAIFAERFIGRYGADRVCVILAELLQRAGHRVTLIGARFSSPVLQRFAAFRVPEPYGWTTAGIERVTLRWFDRHRYFLERYLPPIDVCIVGSFPFITAIPYLRQLGSEVVFLDFGVVPTTGYPRRLRWLVQGVAKVRRRHLRHANTIVAISDFIARSQSERDGAGRTRVATALLGADHLARGTGATRIVQAPLHFCHQPGRDGDQGRPRARSSPAVASGTFRARLLQELAGSD